MSEIETRELICIGCPLGCLLTVEMKGTEVVSGLETPVQMATAMPGRK